MSAEMAEMMQKFRMLEDRKSKTVSLDDPVNNVRTQKQQIAKLKMDNGRLQDDLALETRQAKQANFYSASLQISKLQDQGDMYARKIDAERLNIDQLDKQIREIEASILLQRKDMKGVNAAHEANKAMQKRIRNLENQLDKALVKYNEAQSHNKQLREDINNLRLDRDREAEIQDKLQAELQLKTAMANRLFEDIHAAHRRRDQAQAEIIGIGAHADQSLEHSEQNWQRLGASLERDRQLETWQIGGAGAAGSGSAAQQGDNVSGGESPHKAQSSTPTAQRPAPTKATFAPGSNQAGGMNATGALQAGVSAPVGEFGWEEDVALEEEESLKRKVQKLQAANAKDKRAIEESSAALKNYEESFDKIFKATGNTDMDVDLLVKAFVNAEEANFALFNRVNDMSNEIEKLQERISEIQDEIGKYRGTAALDPSASLRPGDLSATGSIDAGASFSASAASLPPLNIEAGAIGPLGPRGKQNKQKSILRDLQAKREKAQMKSTQYDNKYRAALETVAAVKDSVHEIFKKLRMGDDIDAKVLGSVGVTEGNMMAFLGIIEARSNQLLAQHKYHLRTQSQPDTLSNPGSPTNNSIDTDSLNGGGAADADADADALALDHGGRAREDDDASIGASTGLDESLDDVAHLNV